MVGVDMHPELRADCVRLSINRTGEPASGNCRSLIASCVGWSCHPVWVKDQMGSQNLKHFLCWCALP